MNTEIYDFIKNNEKLIYSIIKRFSNYCDIEDLYQEAAKAIIKAFKNYNKEYNSKLSTYIYNYIFGEIYYYVNNKNKIIKNNRDNLKLLKKINEAKTILTQKLMKEPTIKELSSFLEIDENILNTAINSNTQIQSLDAVVSNDGKEVYLCDIIPNNDEINLDTIFLKEEINKLEDIEKSILNLRFFEDMTQSEVANYLDMNQVQVSRMEHKILKKIKNNITS